MTAPSIKVLVGEVEGEELFSPTERLLHANDMVFDPGSSGITTQNTNTAIQQAKYLGASVSRYAVNLAYKGAANNKWLELNAGIPSSSTPFIVPETCEFVSMSMAVQNGKTTNATLSIYKNGVILDTLVLTAQTKNTKTGLTYPLVAGDELSVYAIQNPAAANTLSDPIICLFIRTTI